MSNLLSHPSGPPSLPGALGVLWSPANPRHRRLAPRLLLPGHRRHGGARRRRGKGQHAACRGAILGGLVFGGTAFSALRIAGLASAS